MLAPTPSVSVSFPNEPVAHFLLRSSQDHRNKPALIDGSTHRSITYGELHDDLRRAAAGMVRRGVRKGEVVAVFGANSPDYVTAFYAVTSIGAVITSLNVLHNVADLSYQLIDAGAKVVLVTCEPTPTLVRAAEKAGIARIWRLDDVREEGSLGDTDADLAIALDARSEVASITYTEAASDVPMGVMVTHGNLMANVQQTRAVDSVDASDVLLGLMPFCQLYGMVAVNLALHASATVVTFPHFSLDWLLQAIERYRVTVAYLVPPIIRTLAKHSDVDKFDLSALKKITAFTAPLPGSVARACAERLRCNVRQAYGLTEAAALTHFTPRESHKIASVGLPVPDTECRVVDVVSRRPVGPEELGEVWVRGPQVMKGYHNFPEVTADVLDSEGWLRTCDIGYTDEDGYLFVVDRSKKLSRLRGLHRQDGELLRAAVEDIAARLKASEKIRVQSVLLNSVRESVVSTDLQDNVTFWNTGAERLFGYSAAEAMGRPVDSLIVPEGVELVEAEKTHALATRGTWSSQVLRRRKDGSLIWTDLVVSVVTDAAGERSGFLAVHRDVTELRRNQELVKESHERTRNLAARLIAIREDERSSIARELHDELGQALTRLNIDVTWLTQQLPQRLKTKRVQAIGPLVDRTVRSIQQLSSQLRPPVLDDLGLEAAIEWHVHEFAEWSGCRCELDLSVGPLSRDKDRDIAIFRILQEALTNVARHARAVVVKVRAVKTGDEFVLHIEDDGIGIPASKLSDHQSFGLAGMAERAEGLGGELHISVPEGEGTIVSLRVRIPQAASEASPHDSPAHC